MKSQREIKMRGYVVTQLPLVMFNHLMGAIFVVVVCLFVLFALSLFMSVCLSLYFTTTSLFGSTKKCSAHWPHCLSFTRIHTQAFFLRFDEERQLQVYLEVIYNSSD